MTILFLLGSFFLLLLPPMDPDLGWQLRCGELILKGQGFCTQNQFSVLMSGYQWPNHHWLYQVLLFSIWQKFGLWGLSLFNAFLVSLIFFIFHQTIKNLHLEKKWAIILILFLTWGVFSWGIRSQLFGLFYFTLILFILLQEKIKLKYYLPLIFLLWANTHGSVVLGLAFLFLYSLKNLQEKTTIFILSLSLLATLINPHGFKIFQVAWQHLSGVRLEKLIAEWVPPNLLNWSLVFLGGFFLLSLSHKTLWPAIASFTFLTLKARRNLPLFFIFFFPLFLNNSSLKNWLKPWLKKQVLRKSLLILTCLAFLFYGLHHQLPQTLKTNSSLNNYCQNSTLNYPCQAVNFLKTQSEKGPLFNRYEWGGFLIWQLPEYKVFVDGRMPAWPTSSGKSPYTIYLETLQAQSGWQETLKQYNINWILISPETFMDLKLKPHPGEFGWQEVYRDPISVIYKKL